MQIVLFVCLYSPISFKIIYSQISKLDEPVIASIPRKPLKLVLGGRLKDNSEFVAQGGFPMTKTQSSPQRVLVLTLKMSFVSIVADGTSILAASARFALTSIPINLLHANVFDAARRKFPTPQVGSIIAAASSAKRLSLM